MEPTVDNWRNELKKFFRSIETVSETALKAIKRGRTRNNLPFDDAFKDFILNRSSARIALVYMNLTLDLEDEQMLCIQDVNHRAGESSQANIGQQFTSTSNIPAYIEQMPIILVQPNDHSLASNITTSTTEQLIISIPPSDPINSNPQQELDGQSIQTGAVADESVIAPNSNNHIEKSTKIPKRLNIASTLADASGAKRVELFQQTTNPNEQSPETIDLTSGHDEAADSLDSNLNNDSQVHQNIRPQKMNETRAAENSKELMRFNQTQQCINTTPERAVKLIACVGNHELKSTDAVTLNENSQIQSVTSNTNTESTSQRKPKGGISDHVARNDEHRQENDSAPVEHQVVSNMQHPRTSSYQEPMNMKTDGVSSDIEHAIEQSQSTFERREGDRTNFGTLVNGNKTKGKQKFARRVDRKRRHKCEYCDYSTEYKKDLTRHIRTHTGERPYGCEVCQKRFNQKPSLIRHMKTHRGVFPFQCSTCCRPLLDENSRKLHEDQCKVKQYECHLCKMVFHTNQNLTEHMRKHTGENLRCSKCPKQFRFKSTFTRHMRTHGKLFRFHCSNCQRGFSKKTPWKLHESRCKVKQFVCYLCGRKFHQHKSNLLRHMRYKHTGEKLFGCSDCPKRFIEKAELLRHVCNQPS